MNIGYNAYVHSIVEYVGTFLWSVVGTVIRNIYFWVTYTWGNSKYFQYDYHLEPNIKIIFNWQLFVRGYSQSKIDNKTSTINIWEYSIIPKAK